MKNFFPALFIFFSVLLIGLLVNFLGGVFWSDKAVYEVTSKSSEGINFVNEYKVKFLPERVVGTFWTDFYISKKGQYAFDYSEDVVNDKFSYKDLDDKYVTHYGLFPKFSWWQLNGFCVIIGAGFVLSIFGEGFWNAIFFILGEAG